ncbi:DUF262 domain-containing protein [Dactylosporangium sp. NBC_01737]|uniref:GmrSD restriction endonuclease domain-containing protein n=1 Tax=Dactylosporangium sp. NBC_01737 TaxID=2975959 RepID=UPI002E0E1CEC|nr:DUF262 domain-containing protein [Dactylosporangium sp. NBC_01737]
MSLAQDLELLEDQLNVERRKVDVATHNFSVRELVRMIAEKELNVAPDYQRMFRWTPEAESTFVESVFLGLPIPPIFVATNVGFQWEVVDGLQRLSTLVHFLSVNKAELAVIARSAPLPLTGLEKLNQLNGLTHEQLPRNLQVYFGRQPLQVVSLTDKSDLQVRFDVFARLNRGSMRLSAQEVRACVYQGKFNDLVSELAAFEPFTKMLKLKKVNQSDGTTAEQVVKFFAYKNYRDSFDGKIEHWLNKYMESVKKNPFNYSKESAAFQDAVKKLAEILGDRQFLRTGHSLTPLVQFETALVAIADLQADGVKIIQPADDWLSDEEFREASGAGSNARTMLTRRITRAKALLSGTV